MRVAFIYTMDEYATLEKPLMSPTSIPFGISSLASILKSEGHAVDVLVLTPDTQLREAIDKFVAEFQCCTSVVHASTSTTSNATTRLVRDHLGSVVHSYS